MREPGWEREPERFPQRELWGLGQARPSRSWASTAVTPQPCACSFVKLVIAMLPHAFCTHTTSSHQH